MKVLFVMRGSSSMKPHCSRIRSSPVCTSPDSRCACSSKLVANGEIVCGEPPTSGAGAPYFVQRSRSFCEIWRFCAGLVVRLARTAQELPSCGYRLVVSLSR